IGAALFVILASPFPARAEDSPPPAQTEPSSRSFGARGSVALDDLFGVRTASPVPEGSIAALDGFDFTGVVSYGTTHTIASNVTATSLRFSPSVDYFVMDRLSLGTRVDGAFVRRWGPSSQIHGHTVGARPRIGYVMPLGDGMWLWPRLTVGYDDNQLD